MQINFYVSYFDLNAGHFFWPSLGQMPQRFFLFFFFLEPDEI